ASDADVCDGDGGAIESLWNEGGGRDSVAGDGSCASECRVGCHRSANATGAFDAGKGVAGDSCSSTSERVTGVIQNKIVFKRKETFCMIVSFLFLYLLQSICCYLLVSFYLRENRYIISLYEHYYYDCLYLKVCIYSD